MLCVIKVFLSVASCFLGPLSIQYKVMFITWIWHTSTICWLMLIDFSWLININISHRVIQTQETISINISKQNLSWCQQTFEHLKQSLLLCSMIFSASPHRLANHSQEYKLQNNKCSWLLWPSACRSQGCETLESLLSSLLLRLDSVEVMKCQRFPLVSVEAC